MKNTLLHHLRQGGLMLALSFAFALPVLAQEQDQSNNATEETESDGRDITIIIEDGGRVMVDGEEITGDGRVVRVGPESHVMVHPRRPFLAPAPGEPMRFHFQDGAWFDDEWADELEDQMANFRVMIPKIEPLVDEAAFIAHQSAEVIKLEQEAIRLAHEAREAEGAERTRLERELRDKLAETLDAKLEARQERIEHLEEQLNEQRETLEERRRNRDEIIDRRLRDLMGEEDTLDW